MKVGEKQWKYSGRQEEKAVEATQEEQEPHRTHILQRKEGSVHSLYARHPLREQRPSQANLGLLCHPTAARRKAPNICVSDALLCTPLTGRITRRAGLSAHINSHISA